MRKTEIKKQLEMVIDELMNYKLSEMLLQSINEAQTDLDKNATAEILTDELNLLSGWLDDFKKDNTAEKVEKANTKKALEIKAAEKAEKAAFKWVSLDGYKMVSVKNSNFMRHLSAMSSRLCDRTFTNFEENLSLFVKKFLY